MATVLQREGRPGWYVKYTDATGRRVRVHVPAATKAEARRIAGDLERRAERQKLGLETRASDATMTLADLGRWWVKRRYPGKSRRKVAAKQCLERHVCAHPLGAVVLPRVTTEALEQLLADQRRPDGSLPAPATINRTRSVLHSVFASARKAKLWVGENPVADVDARRVPKAAIATLRAEEVAVVLRYVLPQWRNMFAAAVWTGMRKGELCGLLKSDVDLRGRTLVVARSYDYATTKGGHADAIPIAEPLVPYLEDAIARSPSALVFPAADGSMRTEESDPQNVLRTALIRAAQSNPADTRLRAGLGGELTDEGAAIARGLVDGWEHKCRRCKARGTPHVESHPDATQRCCPVCNMKLLVCAVPRPVLFKSLRHTAATLLFRAGVDTHRVQRIMRHSNVTTTTGIYGHLVVEDLRAAINTLPAGPVAPEFEPLPIAVGAPQGGAGGPPEGVQILGTHLGTKLPGNSGTVRVGPAPEGSLKPANPRLNGTAGTTRNALPLALDRFTREGSQVRNLVRP